MTRKLIVIYVALSFCFIPYTCLATNGSAEIGSLLSLWSILPFAGILLSIVLFPVAFPQLWHDHFPKISFFWALAFAIPFIYFFGETAFHEIAHMIFIDYIPFMLLLWSLFAVSGGIHIKGTLKGTPAVNSIILLIGTILASFIGTTGASMLLIRPILRSNSWRVYKVHTIVFFIFLVSNIGGALTPLGDPPLFLGFLHGVPFFWTMNILPAMMFAIIVLLFIYFILDSHYYKKENLTALPGSEKEALKIEGSHNFIFLCGIIGAVLFSGSVKLGQINFLGINQTIENVIKDSFLIMMGVASLISTRRQIHRNNKFSWTPIWEVAYLFAGIFITIIPVLAILRSGENGALRVLIKSIDSPAQYFWTVGILSSFLDNAPAYLTFFNSMLGKFYPGLPEASAVALAVAEKIPYLAAISVGAVFMGANTYIGNAPNLMVKSIAEEAGVNMPGFLGYVFKYSLPILIVLFVIMALIFF